MAVKINIDEDNHTNKYANKMKLKLYYLWNNFD